LSFGAVSTLRGASAAFDPIRSDYQSSSNWAPRLDVLQPKFTGSSATLTPWIQVSLSILGHNYPNAVTINSEVSLGFSNSYVTMAKLGHSYCQGGQLQSTAYQSVVNSIQFAGSRSYKCTLREVLLNLPAPIRKPFQLLVDLEPDWTYNLTLTAGFDSTTDACTVTYSLDGVPVESYSPTNTGTLKYPIDQQRHANQLADGPYQVVATATSQSLGISMDCAAGGGFGEFSQVEFWGPYAE
jgi:hypothetical protein